MNTSNTSNDPDQRDRSEAGWDGPWTIVQGDYDGRPIVLRINDGAASLAGSVHYRYQVGVAIPFIAPREDGLPTNDEAERLNVIEDLLCPCMTDNRDGILTVVVTTSGMREFVFYSRNVDQVKDAFEHVRSLVESHELQLLIQDDPDWSVYRQLVL